MEMKAIADHYGLEKSLPEAIAAGVDVLCLGNNLGYDPDITAKAAGILERAVTSGRLPESRIHESCERVLALKRQAAILP
jgi:beta-N-acetylhexosaminidase